MVLDLPDEDGPFVDERLWSWGDSGPRRYGVYGALDRWLTAEVPAKPLRAVLRQRGQSKLPDEYKSKMLAKEIEVRARIQPEIDKYLATGESDPKCSAWPGGFLDRIQQATRELTAALADKIKRRTARRKKVAPPEIPIGFVRNKVRPMVQGLFPLELQPRVLNLLVDAFVFIDSSTIDGLLRGLDPSTAWDVANMYLDDLGLQLLGPEARRSAVGMATGSHCFVMTHRCFDDHDPLADYIVHEAAHMLHDVRRCQLGLPETEANKRLANVYYRERETWAYACEAYSRIVAKTEDLKERASLAEQVKERRWEVDVERVADVLREACSVPNGWPIIARLCGEATRVALPHQPASGLRRSRTRS